MSVGFSAQLPIQQNTSASKTENSTVQNPIEKPNLKQISSEKESLQSYPRPLMKNPSMPNTPPRLPVFKQDIAPKVGEIIFDTNEKLSDLGQNSVVETKAMDFVKSKLEKNKGIVIGDANHALDLTPDFLARNMQDLKNSNVKQIYLEYFRPENQPALDNYFEKGDNLSELASIIATQTPNSNPLVLVQKAKENGIKCIGINQKGSPIERNKIWSEEINKNSQTLKPDEKYVVLCGSGHLQGGMNFEFGAGNSIEELLNIPALKTKDSIINQNSDKVFEYNKFSQLSDNFAQLIFPEK